MDDIVIKVAKYLYKMEYETSNYPIDIETYEFTESILNNLYMKPAQDIVKIVKET